VVKERTQLGRRFSQQILIQKDQKMHHKNMFNPDYRAALASLRSGFKEGSAVTVARLQRYFDCSAKDARQIVNLGRVQGYLTATENKAVFAMNDGESIDCFRAMNEASTMMMLNHINKRHQQELNK
jgi:hypothetical protein